MEQSPTQQLIESFLNGNIREVKLKLAQRSHLQLRQGYQDATGCSDEKATAFADFIKGDISFQHYCNVPR